MTALRAGWRTFWAEPDAVMIPALVAALAWTVAQFLAQAAISGTITRSHSCVRYVDGLADPTRCAAGADARNLGYAAGLLAFLVLGQLFWAVLLHAGLAALGTPVRRRPLAVLGTALLVGVVLTLGTGLGVLPGIVLGYLGQFTMTAVVADGAGPFAAVARSARLTVRSSRSVVGFSLLAPIALGTGLLLCGVGVLPALAVVALGHLHLYRRARA